MKTTPREWFASQIENKLIEVRPSVNQTVPGDAIHVIEYSAFEQAIKERDEAIKINDMNQLIMDGLRRVLATSRMAMNGNTKPLELALAAYDKSPLPPSDAEYSSQIKSELAATEAKLKKAVELLERMRSASMCDFSEMPYWSDQVIKILNGSASIEGMG